MRSSSTAPLTATSATKPGRLWKGLILGVRTRILVWYVVLVALSIVASLLFTRQALFNRSEEQIGRFLVQEVEGFAAMARGTGGGPRKQFDAFFERNLFKANQSILTFVDGRLYRTAARPLPDLQSEWRERWSRVQGREQGTWVGADGSNLYVAQQVGGRGVLVVSYTLAPKYRELDETLTLALEVSLAVLVVASIVAWATAGRVLVPLRALTETARTISETDLTQRIPTAAGACEIAELTRTFNEMLDRLEVAFTSQRDFINDAGHELRTPITIIRGHLELMSNDPDERRETLALVTDELDRMSRFVDELLLLVRAEQPNFLRCEPVEVGTLSEELYAKARALAPRPWRLEITGSGVVRLDRQRITQAVMNLAQNATQYTSADQQIALGSAIDHHSVRFWVRDGGEGIAPADQKRIFERFARAANTRRRSEGAGLGLAICKAIAEAHGGRVELHSRLGQGSTFTVVLPR